MEALLGRVGGELSTRELIRRVGTGASSVQRELARLERAGIVRSRRVGNSRVFSADASHALHPYLQALVIASSCPADISEPLPSPSPVSGHEPYRPGPEPALRGPDSRVAPLLHRLVGACQAHGVTSLALFGVATEPRPELEPRVDIVVRFSDRVPNRFDAYFDLNEELDRIMGIPVHIVEDGTVRNPQLRDEIERTRMVLYDHERFE